MDKFDIKTELRKFKELGEARYFTRMLSIAGRNGLNKQQSRKFAKKCGEIVKKS